MPPGLWPNHLNAQKWWNLKTCIDFTCLIPGHRLCLWLPSLNNQYNKKNFICFHSSFLVLALSLNIFVCNIDICSYDSNVKIHFLKTVNLTEIIPMVKYDIQAWLFYFIVIITIVHSSTLFNKGNTKTQNSWETIIYNNFPMKFFFSCKWLKSNLKISNFQLYIIRKKK